MQRARLGLDRLATSGRHRSAANSMIRAVYPGPTRAEVPGVGTMSSLIARLRERRASSTSSCFGVTTSSGLAGIRPTLMLKNSASLSRSARSHDSTALTAIRRHIPSAGHGRMRPTSSGAQSASPFKSRNTTHRRTRAALLYADSLPSSQFLPLRPYTVPSSKPTDSSIRRSTGTSVSPSTRAGITYRRTAKVAPPWPGPCAAEPSQPASRRLREGAEPPHRSWPQ